MTLSPELMHRLKPVTTSQLSKVRQLYLGLFSAIDTGELPIGSLLPPTRELAVSLGLGRNTVISVYGQLAEEGLLCSEGRRGTQVVYESTTRQTHQGTRWPTSRRSQMLTGAVAHGAFTPGIPDASLFPQKAWRRALSRAAKLPVRNLDYAHRPLPALQKSLVRYLAMYRSLSVDAEQIIITAGTRQSLLLTATLFADADDTVWMESPGYAGAIDAFTQQGLKVQACPVDTEGLMPALQDASPKIIYLTPCFQYPTGVTLSVKRRDRLLKLSMTTGTILFEDDYDSEFRDDSQPRPALASTGVSARVLHAGTFSKLIFPAVRVAWLVVPHANIADANHCLHALGGGSNTVAQAAVTELLDNGDVTKHLYRARSIYARRRRAVLELLTQSPWLLPGVDSSGSLSQVIPLKQALPLKKLELALTGQGIGARPLERFSRQKTTPGICRALVLGLGNVNLLTLTDSVEKLNRAIEEAS